MLDIPPDWLDASFLYSPSLLFRLSDKMAEEESAQPEIQMFVLLDQSHMMSLNLTPCDNSTVKGPSELKLTLSISPSKSVLELKEAIASESDVEKDRQRLIYSGVSTFAASVGLAE